MSRPQVQGAQKHHCSPRQLLPRTVSRRRGASSRLPSRRHRTCLHSWRVCTPLPARNSLPLCLSSPARRGQSTPWVLGLLARGLLRRLSACRHRRSRSGLNSTTVVLATWPSRVASPVGAQLPAVPGLIPQGVPVRRHRGLCPPQCCACFSRTAVR